MLKLFTWYYCLHSPIFDDKASRLSYEKKSAVSLFKTVDHLSTTTIAAIVHPTKYWSETFLNKMATPSKRKIMDTGEKKAPIVKKRFLSMDTVSVFPLKIWHWLFLWYCLIHLTSGILIPVHQTQVFNQSLQTDSTGQCNYLDSRHVKG